MRAPRGERRAASGERVLFAGDLLHYTFQLNDVTYRSPADADPEEGSRTRGAWLDRAEAEGMTMATAHLPPSPFVRLARTGDFRIAALVEQRFQAFRHLQPMIRDRPAGRWPCSWPHTGEGPHPTHPVVTGDRVPS